MEIIGLDNGTWAFSSTACKDQLDKIVEQLGVPVMSREELQVLGLQRGRQISRAEVLFDPEFNFSDVVQPPISAADRTWAAQIGLDLSQ
jgi:hypothetical protein